MAFLSGSLHVHVSAGFSSCSPASPYTAKHACKVHVTLIKWPLVQSFSRWSRPEVAKLFDRWFAVGSTEYQNSSSSWMDELFW